MVWRVARVEGVVALRLVYHVIFEECVVPAKKKTFNDFYEYFKIKIHPNFVSNTKYNKFWTKKIRKTYDNKKYTMVTSNQKSFMVSGFPNSPILNRPTRYQ